MIPIPASAQTSNPCSDPGVDVNPTIFAVISPDHNSTAVLEYKFEIRRETDNVLIQDYTFSKGAMISSSGECYVSPAYTIGPSHARDGITKLYSRFMVVSNDPVLSSDWSAKSAPFVLASKLRVGAILNK